MKHLLTYIAVGLIASGLIGCASPAQSIAQPAATASPIVSASPTPEVTPTAITPATAAPTATTQPQRSWPMKLEDCTIGNVAAKCGTYRVYENRSVGSGRQIDLNIVVLPATSDHVEPDPVLYFAGGPGGAATDVTSLFAAEFSELNKTRDVVLIDQRGTGGSNRLMCPKPDKPFGVEDTEAALAYAESCLKNIEADVRWYTTRAYVDDVNEVRQALGYAKINITGGSYGGTVVQVYLQQYPETVRTAIINNSTLIDYPVFEHIADSSQRALELVFERCAKDEKCHAAFPDPQADLAAAFARLDQQPVETNVWDPAISEPISVTSTVLASVVHNRLLGADTAAQLPRLIHRAVTEDDWDAIAQIFVDRILPQHRAAAGLVMYAVIRCSEPWAITRVDEVARNGQHRLSG